METKQLTQETAEEYINSGGIDCPFCGAKDSVQTDRVDPSTGVAESNCTNCAKTWAEYWKMYGISDDDDMGNPFYAEEPKCHIRVVENMLDEYGQETYLVAILFSPENKTSVILLNSDDPLSCISPGDYDTFLYNCKKQARLWKCELDIRVKREDYFDPDLPDSAYEDKEIK